MFPNLRKLRFNSKVKIEREVLSIVNSSNFACELKLAGMTKEAVLTWRTRLSCDLGQNISDKIIENILTISRNAQIISDNSRTVFGEGAYFNNAKYRDDKNELKELLQALQ